MGVGCPEWTMGGGGVCGVWVELGVAGLKYKWMGGWGDK